MGTFFSSLFYFALAIGVLITVHEFGHFWVARRLGVKVLRFSIGFGKPLWRWQRGPDQTEYVLAAVPLGGYVKMVDEREGEVAPQDLPVAFNRQPLSSRFAIVAAGPLFNFLFAILAYWLVFIIGTTGLKPLVGEVTAASPAATAGIEQGDEITSVDGEQTPTWRDVVLALVDKALDGGSIPVTIRGGAGQQRTVRLNMGSEAAKLDQGNLLSTLGLKPARPQVPPVIGRLESGGAAGQAGLKPGDRIVSADGRPMDEWTPFALYIRKHPGETVHLKVERGGATVPVDVVPKSVKTKGGEIGHIGAAARIPDDYDQRYFTAVRYSPLAAVGQSLHKTWEMSALTLKMVGKMIVGDVSTHNISGPLSIAQFAGTSANAGLSAFVSFLAIVSISLGVLNFLPIPVLDGGHLFYYIIEFFKGSPVSDGVQAFGQKLGLMIIMGLMVIAFYNDIVRLLNS
ncbi:MAG TPA: sigma E protease regulator RseP [Gammaproteobacteria bacterium]|nr:sigma E protease regulator RseP [Gammaproteobacteria bacterium]